MRVETSKVYKLQIICLSSLMKYKIVNDKCVTSNLYQFINILVDRALCKRITNATNSQNLLEQHNGCNIEGIVRRSFINY